MAQNIAEVRIIGYLGRDPETKTVGQSTVAEFNVAVTRSKKDKDAWIETTQWFKCSAWNKTGERAAKLHKGSYVMVHGDLEIRTYVGRDKVEKTAIEISVSRVIDLTQREKSDSDASPKQESKPAKAPKAAPAAAPAQSTDDEDLPF